MAQFFCNKTFLIFIFTGKSIDNSLTQQYQPIEYESSASAPKFLSRGQSYRAVIGDTIVLPCITQDLGKNIDTYIYIYYVVVIVDI